VVGRYMLFLRVDRRGVQLCNASELTLPVGCDVANAAPI